MLMISWSPLEVEENFKTSFSAGWDDTDQSVKPSCCYYLLAGGLCWWILVFQQCFTLFIAQLEWIISKSWLSGVSGVCLKKPRLIQYLCFLAVCQQQTLITLTFGLQSQVSSFLIYNEYLFKVWHRYFRGFLWYCTDKNGPHQKPLALAIISLET